MKIQEILDNDNIGVFISSKAELDYLHSKYPDHFLQEYNENKPYNT